MRQWQRERRNLCARSADMNRRNGWENAPDAALGIE